MNGNMIMDTAKIANSIKRSEQGGTLVEVMITVLILSIAIVGTITVFAQCNIFVNELREHLFVNNALNEGMEEIRGMPYLTLNPPDQDPGDPVIPPPPFNASGLSALNNATGSITVDDTIFSNDKIVKVTLTVNWTGIRRSMSKSLSAYVTDDGINKQ